MGQVQDCLKKFEETLVKYPKCAEGYVLYGQVKILLNNCHSFEKETSTHAHPKVSGPN